MPFGTYEAEKPIKLPTFLQYLKLCSKGVEGKTKFQVEIVWLPGKFPNITLQTNVFRVICSESHPLYGELLEYFKNDDVFSGAKQLHIIVTSIKDATIEVAEHARVNGNWEDLGKSAYKFKLN
mgnify:CR=1 FL=1